MKCLVDMDGVVASFTDAACRVHNLGDVYARPEFLGVWDFCERVNLSAEQFWDPLGEEFWATLEPMHDAFELVELLEKRFGAENICLLTSPCLNHGCFAGKMRWIEKHLPAYKRRVLVGASKQFCAHPDAVLVDDADHNVAAFQEHGGHTILVPRLWNSAHQHADRAVQVVAAELGEFPGLRRQGDQHGDYSR